MSLLLTFMELDKLYESSTRLDRNTIIKALRDLGKEYNFDKYSDEQLYRILERARRADDEDKAMSEYTDLIKADSRKTCPICDTSLNDGGTCPVCDDGEESIFEWVDSQGNQAKRVAAGTTGIAASQQPTTNIVTIVYDVKAHKLRATANDGIHGYANVAFPNNLRTREGQQYEVETLTWNGKNYRASGEITPI